MNNVQNNSINFKASIKLTPNTKKWVLGLSAENQMRFINAQKKLSQLESRDELLLSRKKTMEDGKIIPVLTNLRTGAMIAQFNSPIRKISTASINLIEAAANQRETFARRIFSKNQAVIDNSIERILKKTVELPAHPISHQKLTHIELCKDAQILMKEFENKFPDKEIIFKLSENEKLFIKQYDEGYIYYICNNKNMPNGKYFTATYNNDGFRLNYNEQFITKEEVGKIFNRYTKKTIEKL